MAERVRTSVRGYIPAEKLRPETDFVLHRRGPRRTSIGQDLHDEAMEYAEAAGILATAPEALVHWALTRRGLVDGVHFSFQSSLLGGRLELGGMVADFKFLDRPLILRVMGEYWHRPWDRMGGGKSDEEQRLVLEQYGWTVLDMSEHDILDRDWLEDFMRRHIDTPVPRAMQTWQR